VVSDEDDCSALNPSLFAPNDRLDPTFPLELALSQQGFGVRCALNPDLLFPTSRYAGALKALRPDREQLVVFGALVGVPPETVDAASLAAVDFADRAARGAFYDHIQNHDAMKQIVDDRGTSDASDDALRASCRGPHGSAQPPRRIVDVAKRFGANGIVQSICEDDYGPAMDAIAERIAQHLGASCLEREQQRAEDGTIACDVIWELPPPASAPAGTPISCDDADWSTFLSPVDARGAMKKTADGGARCRVVQLPVIQPGPKPVFGMAEVDGVFVREGWYYDDFTEEVRRECRDRTTLRRIAFTPSAAPPTGVRVVLDCAR
jgi:hypothetical protein